MSQTIQLPWRTPPLTANQVRRLGYQAEARVKRTLNGEAMTSIRRAKTEPMDAAEVTLHYRPGTWRICDSDGMFPTLKVVLDSLVKAGVLPKDDFKFVPISSCYIHEPTRGVPASMWITLEEVYK